MSSQPKAPEAAGLAGARPASLPLRGPVPGLSKGTYSHASGGRQVVRVHLKDVQIVRPTGVQVGGGRRGKVCGLSKASARRLRFSVRNNPALNRLGNWWVALTYPAEFPRDGRIVKGHLRAVGERWKRRGWCFVWCLEYQQRGAPHFHLILCGGEGLTPEAMRTLIARDWYEVVGSGDDKHLRAGVSCDLTNNPEGADGYLSGYLVKQDQKTVPAGTLAPGRMWGVIGTKLPPPVELECGRGDWDVVQLLRIMRRGARSESAWRSRQPHRPTMAEARKAIRDLWSKENREKSERMTIERDGVAVEVMMYPQERCRLFAERFRAVGVWDLTKFAGCGGATYRPRSGGKCGATIYGAAHLARAAIARGLVNPNNDAVRKVLAALGGRVVGVEPAPR